MAGERRQAASLLVPLGALMASAGLMMISLEYEHGPDRAGGESSRLVACSVQLQLGTFLAMEGTHAVLAGLGLAGMAAHLLQLARVREVEGPDPVWGRWYGSGRGLRVMGNVLVAVGSLGLSAGVSYLAPFPACERLHCEDGCPLHPATQRSFRLTGTVVASLGAAVLVVGGVMLAAGYIGRYRVIRNRHALAPAGVALSAGPGGIGLTW
jgi:hypothetical protein